MSYDVDCYVSKKYGAKCNSDVVFGLRVDGVLRPFYTCEDMRLETIELLEKYDPDVVPHVEIVVGSKTVTIKADEEDEIYTMFYVCNSCGCTRIMGGFNYCPECGGEIV